jgi:hypothetical protein
MLQAHPTTLKCKSLNENESNTKKKKEKKLDQIQASYNKLSSSAHARGMDAWILRIKS